MFLFRWKVNKFPSFDGNFNIRRQLGHFKYELNQTYVTKKKSYNWYLDKFYVFGKHAKILTNVFDIFYSTYFEIDLFCLYFQQTNIIKADILHYALSLHIVGRSQKLEKNIPIIFELTWQAYSWEVI